MKILNISGTGLAMAMAGAMALSCAAPAWAETPPDGPATAPVAAPLLVPADFAVPTSAQGEGFRLAPLGPDLVKIDFDAYMSSIAHLQATFTRSDRWPHAGISAADAMLDMETEQARFKNRQSFAYAILTPDGQRERGSVYVSPSPVAGYDAMVRLWVTKAEYDAGFDAVAYQWVRNWVAREWPFARVAWPGRAIGWTEWDAMVAAGKTGKAGG